MVVQRGEMLAMIKVVISDWEECHLFATVEDDGAR